jgi:exosortase A
MALDSEARHDASRPAHSLSGSGGAVLPARWLTPLVIVGIVLAIFGLCFWTAIERAVAVWWASTAYNHGFLVIPIAGYLIWERRAIVAALSPKPFPWALAALPPLGAAWLVAHVAGILEAEQLLIVGMLQAALLTILGVRVYRAILFPLLFLFFLVPTGEFLVPSLQDFTAQFVVIGLRMTGVPVYMDGVFLQIPNGNFHVAEACAGLRFLIANVAFGFLFADLIYRSYVRRAIFVAICIITPIIANGFRAYGIVMLAHLTDNKLAAGADHLIYGWIFFSLVMLMLIGIGLSFRDAGPDRRAPTEAAASPNRRTPPQAETPPLTMALAATALIAMVGAAPAYAAWLESRHATGAPVIALQPTEAPWTMRADGVPQLAWRPTFTKADATLMNRYDDGTGRTVDLFIAYYLDQNPNKKMISRENRLADGETWEIVRRWGTGVEVAGETVPADAIEIVGPGGRRQVVLSWYWVDGAFNASPPMTKLLQVKAQLVDRRPEAAFVALSTDSDEEPQKAVQAIRDALRHLGPLKPALAQAAAAAHR